MAWKWFSLAVRELDLVSGGVSLAIDRSDMLGAVEGLPAQCREAWTLFEPQSGPPVLPRTNIGVMGMGGSGISGDVAAMVVETTSPVPVWVLKGPEVPAFVGGDSYVIAVSYSGNTAETLTACAEAIERGAQVACVCSGGKLLEIAGSRGLKTVVIPSGMQPRAAFGYLATVVSGLVAAAAGVEIEDQVFEAIELLEVMSRDLGRKAAPEDNPAMLLAAQMADRVPIIYGGSAPAKVAARRWKCQINENSKSPAFFNEYPEFGHNELVGWAGNDPLASTAHLVALLDEAFDFGDLETALAIARPGVSGLSKVRSKGLTPMGRCMSLAYMGDFVSVYLALASGTDPTPVAAIDELKKRVKQGAS